MQILNLKMAKCLNQRNDDEFILLGNQLQLFNFSRTAQTDTYTLVNSWIYTLHTLVIRRICSNTVQTMYTVGNENTLQSIIALRQRSCFLLVFLRVLGQVQEKQRDRQKQRGRQTQ